MGARGSVAMALVGRSEVGDEEGESERFLFALVCEAGRVSLEDLLELLVSVMSAFGASLLLRLSVVLKQEVVPVSRVDGMVFNV
jgi:hypothetical protein